jgi:hypothetical protein
LHGLPYQQQLHIHFGEYGLLWVPPDGVDQHANAGRQHTESRFGRVPNIAVLELPRHDELCGFDVQPHDYRLPVDQLAPIGAGRQGDGLRAVPHQQQLHAEHSADGLRELRMPLDDMATDEQSNALDGGLSVCDGELLDVP